MVNVAVAWEDKFYAWVFRDAQGREIEECEGCGLHAHMWLSNTLDLGEGITLADRHVGLNEQRLLKLPPAQTRAGTIVVNVLPQASQLCFDF